MKYGIEKKMVDDVPGMRDRWTETDWYETEEERDAAYTRLEEMQKPSNDPETQLIEQWQDGEGFDVVRSFSKVEKD